MRWHLNGHMKSMNCEQYQLILFCFWKDNLAWDRFRPTAKMALVKLVQRQQTKWPRTHGKFQPSRVTIAQLKSALLDPVCAFTTNNPPVMAPYPPKSTGQSTTPASLAPLPAAPGM
jgi:hypothetical protein